MTQKEIVTALLNDWEIPYLQDWQAREIVDFVIKNYTPSLPSNLDEAAEEANKSGLIGFDRVCWLTKETPKHYFKTGAEWMAGQGETRDDIVVTGDFGGKARIFPIPSSKFNPGDKVVVQIRKK